MSVVECEGSNYFRQRVVFSLLSGKPLKISNIRSLEDNPGLRGASPILSHLLCADHRVAVLIPADHELSFLKLIESITNGTIVKISYTGTTVAVKPGVIIGGKVTHDCGTARAIGYYLEPLLMLAPFSKNGFMLTLLGITNDQQDVSVDTLRTVALPQLAKFGVDSDVELKVEKRGAPPNGGGQVFFRCVPVRSLKPINCTDDGRIKRIRGIAYSTRVSPQTANVVIESARSLLNHFIPDVFIYTDHYKGAESGRSPGYGLALVAESTTGALLSAESCGMGGEPPAEAGIRAAKLLYAEIAKGGYCDATQQPLNLLMMALGPEDVSKIRFGKLTPFSYEI